MRRAKKLSLAILFVTLGLVAIKVPYELFRSWAHGLGETQGYVGRLGGAISIHTVALLGMVALLWVFALRIDKLPLSGIGLGWNRHGLAQLVVGFTITAVTGATTVAFFHLNRNLDVHVIAPGPGSIITILLLSAVAGLVQATVEELWMRSWALRSIAQVVGNEWAAIVVGGGFGLLHLANPNYSLWAVLCAAVAGVMLSFSVFRTGQLWMAIGLHFGWNMITGGVLYNSLLFTVQTVDGVTVDQFIGAEATPAGVALTVLSAVLVISWPRSLKRLCGESVRWPPATGAL